MIYELLKILTFYTLVIFVKFFAVILIPSYLFSIASYEIGLQVGVNTFTKILTALWIFSYCFRTQITTKNENE